MGHRVVGQKCALLEVILETTWEGFLEEMFFELSPDWQEEASLGKESQAEGQQMQWPCSRDLHAMCQQWKDGRWPSACREEEQEISLERSEEAVL